MHSKELFSSSSIQINSNIVIVFCDVYVFLILVDVNSTVAGVLSDELKQALGMKEGYPPPWIYNMQRYGPPPSYPKLRIPGVNAPIPPGYLLHTITQSHNHIIESCCNVFVCSVRFFVF
jgi:hypothetical protein